MAHHTGDLGLDYLGKYCDSRIEGGMSVAEFNALKIGDQVRSIDKNFKHVPYGEIFTIEEISDEGWLAFRSEFDTTADDHELSSAWACCFTVVANDTDILLRAFQGL